MAREILRRDVCAPGKELPHQLQLKRSKGFETSSSGAPGSQSGSASRDLQMSSTTVWRVTRKRLHTIPYKLHLLQQLKDTDKLAREAFFAQMQAMLKDGFDNRLVFSKEATFNLTGKVNKHNTRVWETELPHSTLELGRDSPKVNVFCTISKKRVYGPFFFEGTTVNSKAYLDMLQNCLMELLFDGEQADFLFQQDGAPPHWSLIVRQYLNVTLHSRWIGRAVNDDRVLLHCPP